MEGLPIAILVAVAVIESIMSLAWVGLYFTTGIQVFSHEVTASNPGAPVPTARELSERLPRSEYPALVFHNLGSNRVAFREAWFGTTYTPVMHGLLEFDPLQAKVRVTGLANWFTLFLVLVFPFAVLLWSTLALEVVPFFVLLVGLLVLIYRTQAKRFTEAATAAVNAWSGAIHPARPHSVA